MLIEPVWPSDALSVGAGRLSWSFLKGETDNTLVRSEGEKAHATGATPVGGYRGEKSPC